MEWRSTQSGIEEPELRTYWISCQSKDNNDLPPALSGDIEDNTAGTLPCTPMRGVPEAIHLPRIDEACKKGIFGLRLGTISKRTGEGRNSMIATGLGPLNNPWMVQPCTLTYIRTNNHLVTGRVKLFSWDTLNRIN